MLGDITQEIIELYTWIRNEAVVEPFVIVLADALRDAHAAKMKAEHELAHLKRINADGVHLCGMAPECKGKDRTNAQWQDAAHAKLMGEG